MDSHPLDPAISVTAPVSTALDWTGRVLFQPFELNKWFVLGFCAWLAWIGQNGGGGVGWQNPFDEFSRVEQWVQDHVALFVVLLVFGAIVILALGILLTWLSSRGKLMFLDGVVHNRGAVVEPWHRYRGQANSLFGFRVVVGLSFVVVWGVLISSMALVLFALDFDTQDPGFGAILVISLFALAGLPVIVLMVLIGIAINDLMVPIQWLRGCRAMPAWNEARGLIARHVWVFARYALMKFLLAVAIVLISCVLICVTCCIAVLPYIGTVILLPLYVFGRSYSMHFLSQFGPAYAPLGPGGGVYPRASAPPATPPDSGWERPA